MPLRYKDRGTSGTQLEALSGDLAVGSVRKNVLSIAAGGGTNWSWTLYVSTTPTSPLPGFRMHGSGETREAAQADLEKNWERWVTAAGLRDGQ